VGANRCSRCGAENSGNPKFCNACGRKFVPLAEPLLVGDEPGLYYCYKHPKETTRVTCGRCERPLCHRCVVIGSVGVRCRQCASNKIPIRMRGVMHDAGRGVRGVGRSIGSRPVWYLWIWSIIIRFIMGFFGR
jgi:hypothetical protein